jgi:hypothetical protein
MSGSHAGSSGQSGGDLHLSDLEHHSSRLRVPSTSAQRWDDFQQSCETANRDIEAARNDLQSLMTKAHAYATTTGVASGTPILTSTPPRHRRPAVARPRVSPIVPLLS